MPQSGHATEQLMNGRHDIVLLDDLVGLQQEQPSAGGTKAALPARPKVGGLECRTPTPRSHCRWGSALTSIGLQTPDTLTCPLRACRSSGSRCARSRSM